MSLTSGGGRPAYLIYGALCLLVVGVLSWATAVSLRLARADRLATEQREQDDRVRLAMYRMENLANPLLFNEIRREYWQYAPFYRPNTEHVRFATGEVLPQGALVQPSPLLLNPPPEWVLLHFQVSPQAGWRSPQVPPEEARGWPGFKATYDAWDRTRFLALLNALAYSYTLDELVTEYARAGGPCADALQHLITADQQAQALVANAPRSPSPGQTRKQNVRHSDFTHRRQATEIVQRAHEPQLVCEPRPLAEANLLDTDVSARLRSAEREADDREVGISYQRMTPVWLKLVGRNSSDLAFLRPVEAGGEVAVVGFVVDWPRFRELLLASIRDLFPRADLQCLSTLDWPEEEPVLSSIPARLVINQSAVAPPPGRWDSTHTTLAVGWAASLSLLGALGVGIRSLVALARRRSQFAFAVTHELRTPLTTFRLYSDMLANGLVSPDNRQAYLETLNDESRRLADLVTSVLEYSRVENNRVPVNKEPVPLTGLLAEISQRYLARCQRSGMCLETDASRVGEDVVRTDRQLVLQIVGNLIDNACKYGRQPGTPPETVSPVRVVAEKLNGQLRIDVIDRGPGVPPRSRGRIFRPYHRAETAPATAGGGIGLGLTLSRSWAQLLGGRLELLPNPAGEPGARFRLTLPAN